MRDLVVLVADRNAEFCVAGGLARFAALGTRQIDFKILSHPGHDGGVRKNGVDLLRLERRGFSHALMVLDYEGCGSELAASAVEAELDARLASHWGTAAKAIVIAPEVDLWLWGAETHIKEVVGWEFPEGIREWLISQGFAFDEDQKPARPKEAFEAVCRRTRSARSSALYRSLSQRVSLARCQDPPFQRLRSVVRGWFPPDEIPEEALAQ